MFALSFLVGLGGWFAIENSDGTLHSFLLAFVCQGAAILLVRYFTGEP